MTTQQKMLLPRSRDVGLFVRWTNEGAAPFLGSSRKEALISLKELIRRLGLPPRYEAMRCEITGQGSGGRSKGGRFGQAPREELRSEIYRVLRLYGYVHWSADGKTLTPTPLTPLQLLVVGRLAWGHSTAEIAADLGITATAVNERLRWVRDELGCRTTFQVIGCVYRNRWLPDHDEHRRLLTSGPRGQIISRGYRLVGAS